MEVTSMHLGQRVSCNCNVTDSLLISAPLASDALLLRCCPQLLPASSLPFPPCSMPSDRPLRLPPFRLTASQRTGASYALAMCTVASRDGSGCRFFVLLASSPPVLPIFSVPPSISFADLFCRGDLDTQKRSVSHCLSDVSNCCLGGGGPLSSGLLGGLPGLFLWLLQLPDLAPHPSATLSQESFCASFF